MIATRRRMSMRATSVLVATVMALVLMVTLFAVLPGHSAIASSANGTVTRINNPGTHGVIVRTDDHSNDRYQFRIPQDVLGSPLIEGDFVTFEPIQNPAKRAVGVSKPPYP